MAAEGRVAAVVLREDQVQRYSRAILLQGVGGEGQQALLQTGVRLTAGGAALLTAAAYLGAAGTPVAGPPGLLAPGDEGFLVQASDIGLAAAPTLRRRLERLNADAVSTPKCFGTLVALPDGCDGSRPLVAVGQREGRTVLWGAGGEACGDCLGEVVRGASPPGAGAEAVQVGALAALLFQRLVLGLAPALSGLAVGPTGAMEVLLAPGCPHRPEFPASVLLEAVRHLEACYPEEGCGVVLQSPAGARWMALPNAYGAWAARDPAAFTRDARSAFLFEPAQWLALLREADARRETLACVVHAHPDGPAAFSAEDRAQAAPGGEPLLPGTAYLVVALKKGRATAAAWVRWQGGQFHEVPVRLPS
ncbi:MAG: Mov34/MPN/PAD-1 family protein [Myxococcaceae bacterium]